MTAHVLFYARREDPPAGLGAPEVKFPVTVQLFYRDAQTAVLPATEEERFPDSVGYIKLTEAGASLLKAGVQFAGRFGPISSRLLMVWDGWEPPAPPKDLPLDQFGKLMETLPFFRAKR